jgi:hypothetical protein
MGCKGTAMVNSPVIPDSELVNALTTLSLKVGFRVLVTPTNQHEHRET